VTKLAVTKTPHSGKPAELIADQGIDANGIAAKVRELRSSSVWISRMGGANVPPISLCQILDWSE